MQKKISTLILSLALIAATGPVSAEDVDKVLRIDPNNPETLESTNMLENPAYAARRQAKKQERARIRARLFDGTGPMASVVDPRQMFSGLSARYNMPMGKDVNGHPTDLVKEQGRTFARHFADSYVRRHAELVKEGKLPAIQRRDQVAEWRQKTAETKAKIAKDGPITTKNFTRPGMTPEESRRYYLSSTRVRWNKGKFEPIYDENDPEAKKIGPSKAFLEKESRRQALIEAAKTSERRRPVEKVRVIRKITGIDAAQDDVNRGVIDHRIDAETLARYAEKTRERERENESVEFNEGEATRSLQEAFPDALPSSGLGDFFGFILGVRNANAGELDFTTNRHADRFKGGLGLRTNPGALTDRFDDFAREAHENEEEIRKAAENAKENTDTKCADCAAPRPVPFEAIRQALDLKRQAQAAPSNVAKPSSEQSERTAELLEGLQNPASQSEFFKTLRATLASHPEILKEIPDARERLDAMQEGREATLAKLAPEERKKYEVTYVFVSYSMGDDVLADIFKRVAGKPDTTVVMRGLPEGMTFAQGFARFKEIVVKNNITVMPNFTIDPPLFRAYGVKQVPTVVRAQGLPPAAEITTPRREHPALIAKVEGLASDEWLKDRIEEGGKGDLGNRGNVYTIAEPDLIEVMKKKMLSVNWKKKQEEAFERYWDTRQFDVLPLADRTAERRIDPSFTVPADVKDLAGNLIYARGSRVNPLDIRPFTKTIIVFNPTREDEINRVDAYLAEHREAGLGKPIFVLTEIDRKKGWDAYKSVSDRYDSHMYFLIPEFKTVWGVKTTPSVVWADNDAKEFALRELGPLGEGEKTQ